MEIGPGVGVLTQQLAKKAGKVIAVEKDQKMCEILKEILKNFKNVEIFNDDVLKWKPNYKLLTTNYKVIANLPYYITAPVLRKFLESKYLPQEMVLMVQKEVARRICAKPPDMSLLTVSVQFYSKPKIISYVSKRSFWPQPKVDSAIIKITPQDLQRPGLCGLFFKIVRAGFSHPRKQLLNNLSKGLVLSSPNGLKLNKPSQILSCKTWAGKDKVKLWLKKNKIQPTQRAETLSVKNWVDLSKTFKKI